MLRRLVVVIAMVVLPVWSGLSVIKGLHGVQWHLIVTTRALSHAEAFVVSHLVILVVWAVVVARVMIGWRARQRTRRSISAQGASTGVLGRAAAWLSASAILAPSSPGAPVPARIEATTPVGTMLSPAMAAIVLAHVLRRRREQAAGIDFEGRPDRLTESETATLGTLRHLAIEYDSVHGGLGLIDGDDTVTAERLNSSLSNPAVRELLSGVERRLEDRSEPVHRVVREWQVLVRVFGYPLVTNAHGVVADFRKKRALELLTWLSLNRSRQRRSAARTALWEVDVSDGTFSTVVSEMRRSLADLYPSSDAREWCPATYSDEIPLKTTVVTDADLLDDALQRFRIDDGTVGELVDCLALIRDVPFAGTAYSWADLDGTTTRLVILAIDAATTVARWGIEHDRTDVVTEAVAAGLRVMPGCEELLEMQEQLVRSRPLRAGARPRRGTTQSR